ncbi:formylmethanofuran dehydrogenase subunit C [Methanohalobium evestigatum Z-7303]|uniref:formylmethanofuran dehydrogenase n=1 Tax=Methanohalobium evestigatum (strain ATCC BAA-1072 / DSM 3721 / NBRC 107634 / OCM 161 / Z-7303) TaxID=644295 RepID=D7EB71_METEZ|nr:formylmethanofuran dehydrogenase subunit C [Methanohalobium evestigatum]ADI74588.1 formylmethanofuran dehydrogenase subunit C [Methanohalobium evestigatum Z-7303]
MQTVNLELKEKNSIPVEAENIKPDVFASKSKEEIEDIELWHGKKPVKISELFDVEVDGSDSAENVKIIMSGDFSRMKRIGQGMNTGEMEINGNVDMHCGCHMSGGKITVNGDADNWLGREMTGGEIVVNGNAGYYVGSGYRGEGCGMGGGKITINGDVRDYLGEHMCGGEILVNGNAGLLPAISNNGGTIIIEGNSTMAAVEMKKGTVVVKGQLAELMPSYREEGTEEYEGETYRKFTGDVNVNGKGVLLVK